MWVGDRWGMYLLVPPSLMVLRYSALAGCGTSLSSLSRGRQRSMGSSCSPALLWMMMESSAGWGTGRGTHSLGRVEGRPRGTTPHRLLRRAPCREARWVPVVASGLKMLGSR